MSPNSFNLKSIVRPNIWALQPYRCARDDYSIGILLDANENAFGPSLPSDYYNNGHNHDLNLERYPDPHHIQLKNQLIKWRKGVVPSTDYIFIGVGSDEVLDLVMRVFGTPGTDKILVCPPTYGMYSVSANINDLSVVEVPLLPPNQGFQLNLNQILLTLRNDPLIKLVFLCSPGNPTGSYLNHTDILRILNDDDWNGIVIVDEAYIDFTDGIDSNGNKKSSMISYITEYPNLFVSQTFSKSFGLAGARLGVAYSNPNVISLLNKTKAPYNVSSPAANLAITALSPNGLNTFTTNLSAIISQRTRMLVELPQLPHAGRIIGTNDANFILIEVLNTNNQPCNTTALSLYKTLAEKHNVVVRFRGNEPGCMGCLRITIGTAQENDVVLAKWRKYFTSLTINT